MGSGDESLWQTEKNFHYETFFLPPLCVRECARLYHEKLADSNSEKLYLAGFLRHGFLIKCAFTFFSFICSDFMPLLLVPERSFRLRQTD